jgi:hypothetical protein
MALGSEQQEVLDLIKRRARVKRARPIQVKAAIETGLVESGLRNLPGGDADSAGWRQERKRYYKDPTNLVASIDRFFEETAPLVGKYSRAGDLAAAVQRPAAQYRGRYQAVSARAQALMEGGGGSSGGSTRTITTTTGPPTTPEGLTRPQLLQQYLATRGQPGGLLSLAGGLGSLKAQTSTKTTPSPGDRLAVGEELATYVQRANAINAKQLPYHQSACLGGIHEVGQARRRQRQGRRGLRQQGSRPHEHRREVLWHQQKQPWWWSRLDPAQQGQQGVPAELHGTAPLAA